MCLGKIKKKQKNYVNYLKKGIKYTHTRKKGVSSILNFYNFEKIKECGGFLFKIFEHESLIRSTNVALAGNVWCYEQVCLAKMFKLPKMLLANLLIARVSGSLLFGN